MRHLSFVVRAIGLDVFEASNEVFDEAGKHGEHQGVLKNSLDEVLIAYHLFEFSEFYRVFGGLFFERFYEVAELMVGIYTSLFDVVKDFIFVDIATVLTI
jgi:hypothetical protein